MCCSGPSAHDSRFEAPPCSSMVKSLVSLRDALTTAIDRLTAARVPSPRMNAELLLRFTLDCDRAYLYAHPERELTTVEQTRYEEALAQRARGIPAQYITGHQEFWGMDLIVNPAVLIPRPETEHVIETVLQLVNGGRASLPGMRIVDVGTGSGCIALALARANAARHQLENRIQFHETDLLQCLERARLDFVVSNPPYVGESEQDQVQLGVRKFEPRDAVFAGPTGLEVIERLIPQAQSALKPGGWLVMEISGTIAQGVKRLLGRWNN